MYQPIDLERNQGPNYFNFFSSEEDRKKRWVGVLILHKKTNTYWFYIRPPQYKQVKHGLALHSVNLLTNIRSEINNQNLKSLALFFPGVDKIKDVNQISEILNQLELKLSKCLEK